MRFLQRILRINRPVLGLPALGAPSAAVHGVRQSPVQGSSVPSRFVPRKQFRGTSSEPNLTTMLASRSGRGGRSGKRGFFTQAGNGPTLATKVSRC